MRDLEGEFRGLTLRLFGLFERGVGEPLSDDEFNELALRVFRFQCRANGAYGAFAARRGLDPEKMVRWEDVPYLPTQAFKAADLVAGTSPPPEAVFRTSGTTRGSATRGRHPVRALQVYRGSLLASFRAYLLPEGEELPLLAFLPDPVDAPESSLSFMVGEVRERLCGGRGGFFAGPDGGLRMGEIHAALRDAEEGGEPVLLAGTAFAFAHWLETAENEGWRIRLAEGSRLMETGGFKGRSRALSREDLYLGLERCFGIPMWRMVNEYGMTELLSQFYEPVLSSAGPEPRAGGLLGRYHVGPPWVRTRVLDPLTLEPLAEGEVGILAHLDLANLGSVSAVLTEDLGRLVPGGFRLQGRVQGAEPRGCSLAMEDFLGALKGGPYAL